MKYPLLKTLMVLAGLLVVTACGKKDAAHDDHGHEDHSSHSHDEHSGHDHEDHSGHDHGTVGPNGGQLVEVGDHLAHLEILHTPEDKKLTIHVLGPHANEALSLPVAPMLNLIVNGEPVQVVLDGESSTFTGEHEALAGEPDGHIALNLHGKAYRLPIAHSH